MNIDSIIVTIIDKHTNTRMLVEEHTQVSAPKLVFNGADDKYQSIMASEFSFNLLVRNNTDGYFFHLYTGNERRYYVTVTDQDLSLIFEGWLLPDFYEEPFTNGVMFVNLTATDGIASLKSKYLENSDYQKEINVIELISKCLQKTGLEKTIQLAPAIESAATNYKWHEITVNCESYLDGEIKYVPGEFFFSVGRIVFPKRKNCYEILDLLCVSLGCTFFGYGNEWFIEGINRKHEVFQPVYTYNYLGVFQAQNTLIKSVEALVNHFNTTPTVSVVSPWKIVNVSWDIKEDGNLVPKWAYESAEFLGIYAPVQNSPTDFWKSNGNITPNFQSKNLTFQYQLLSGWSFELPEPLPPYNLYVYGTTAVSGNMYGESEANFENNFLNIKNKKYLKISDKYIKRSFDIRINFKGGGVWTVSGIPDIPDGEYSPMFRIDLLSGNSKIITTKYTTSAVVSKKFETHRYDSSIMASASIQVGDYYQAKAECVTAKLETENDVLPGNGFFDIKLHAPVSPDFTNPYFRGYVVDSIEVKYTEQDTWSDVLEREIDFSTIYDLDFFHGDSIQDLSERQWRFRRYIPQPPINNQVNVLDAYINYGEFVTSWFFVIDYASAQLILNNHTLLEWNLPNPEGVKNVDEMMQNPITGASNYNIRWSVQQVSGVWVLMFVPTPYMVNLGFDYFKTKPLSVDLDGGIPPFFGWVTENNEWRESWKRFGETEDIRYGVALGKIYHDVQSGPVIKIEGTALKLISPRELIDFKWMGNKNFIPTRLELDFSEGKTTLLMLEATHEIVTDYVD